jgi:hypothetical protein
MSYPYQESLYSSREAMDQRGCEEENLWMKGRMILLVGKTLMPCMVLQLI